ncbi:hypothetical protein GCM10017783_20680 [Deinococcus piscis]|uniref:Uncharacterized protein n=1 Tax=Deinococcus piscis TaxID=394230 RepID=A0ABQ3KBZ5_9DEIO|nr:hypothetical protein [Deinococcus piscis]GHG07922.1 hypothetical protein GCM10017783_20680 [Deinococcus piscis]
MKRRFPKKDSPEFKDIMDAAETLRRELTQAGHSLKREWDSEQKNEWEGKQGRSPQRVRGRTNTPDRPVTVLHETPIQPMSTPPVTAQGGFSTESTVTELANTELTQPLQVPSAVVPARSHHPVGQARQGLEVYALHELDRFEQAMQSLGVDLRSAQVQLIWMPDQADRKGRQGLKVYPVAELGERVYTLSQSSSTPEVVEVQGQHLHLLWEGESVPVGAAHWAQLDRWRAFGGEPLRWLAQLRRSDWSWVPWVAVMVAAFNIWWVLGLAWIFGSGYLFGNDGVKAYRQGYFEDSAPPDSTKELLWHLRRESSEGPSLVPGMQDVPDHLRRTPAPAQTPAVPTTPATSTQLRPALDQLPDDLAAGLRMVRERVADLPEEDILTAEGYRLRGLAERCEEAARLYLRLPAGSEAAETAASEVRAMLQESLEALAGAGSRSLQQQEEVLRAIQDLRRTSVPASDPLRLD